jgi:hypothetical protein
MFLNEDSPKKEPCKEIDLEWCVAILFEIEYRPAEMHEN